MSTSGPRWWRWQSGRQGTGYAKLLLVQSYWPLPFDLYVLRYRTGSSVPPHQDRVPSGRHYRLNWVLRAAIQGGRFLCPTMLWSWRQRVFCFRPDAVVHEVTPIEQGTRYVLSLGWVRGAERRVRPAA